MSLTSFLLGSKSSGKKKAIDTELDTLFNSQTTSERPESTTNDEPTPEKKKKRRSDVHSDEPDSKRSKPSPADATSSSPPRKQKKSGTNRVRIAPEPVSEPTISDVTKAESSGGVSSHASDSESSDDDADASTLIHESLQKDKPSKPPGNRKAKYAPSDETKERRDARTIFIGNLAPDVAVKRPLQKQLHRHILALIPTAKIESTRFRSVAFQTPTSKLPEASDEAKKNKQPRQHDRDRASLWRDKHPGDESKTDEKKFLTPSQKKKIAFINQDIHSDADSVHAYIVFAYPPSPNSRPANLPPPPPVMDPFEAARLATERCNGTVFLHRMLRVDAVVKRSTTEGFSHSTVLSSAIGDPKLTIFVGNLDFASKEDDLRVFFEGIVSAERGPPDVEGSQEGDKPNCWVTRVRTIRDKDTQLGKGFAYVQFSDRTCVDEILALEQGKLKFAKRKLRVQRCKSVPNATSVKNAPPAKPTQTSNRTAVPPVPKGDPSLGEKLVKLSKEERKHVKAADADRVARRMAKKKARMALAKQDMSLQTKRGERVRKASTAKKPGAPPKKKASKGRARSEKSIAKMNTKK
ncbi:hypothetical protein V8E55_011770 [Tylopilus felleus]